MGCGSSRSAVAVLEVPDSTKVTPTKFPSMQNFSAKPSQNDLKINNKENMESSVGSLTSTNLAAGSEISLRDDARKREKSSTSVKSKDSGVFDDRDETRSSTTSRMSSSEINTSKPPSARNSARKKLLRIDDNLMSNDATLDDSFINVISRPKSRFGNVAFDLVLDTPETGNFKKRPAKLAKLENKKRRRSKKTKEQLDKKMQEAEERRKIQENEKQLKAKQFQQFSIHTTVEPFKPLTDDEEEVEK